MGRARRPRWWLVILLPAALLPYVAMSGGGAAADTAVPLWERTSYRSFDRSFKCDLLEQQGLYPQVVVLGGSRSMRMDPSTIRRETGLPSFNFGLHMGTPEDAWAITNYLIDRRPDRPPFVIWCIQVSNLSDVKLTAGLIREERLSRYLPDAVVAAGMDRALAAHVPDLIKGRRFDRYGMLRWNRYDTKSANGLILDRSLTNYLDADCLRTAGNGVVPKDTRALRYFERTLSALNERGIKPLVVIMPLHPRALKAFLAAGWGVKIRWLRGYLGRLSATGKIGVVDCLRISTFGGSPDGFYDGSHMRIGNSRRLLRYCIARMPSCFRVHEDWIVSPTPLPSPTPSASPNPSPSVSPSG